MLQLRAIIADRRLTRQICALQAVLFVAVGWWPLTPHPANQVSWLSNRDGLAFRPFGVIYGRFELPPATDRRTATLDPGFTLDLALQPSPKPHDGVTHVLTIDNGRAPEPLMIGQWRSELLLRIPAQTPAGIREIEIGMPSGQEAHVITISGDGSGTVFYVDGRPVKRRPELVLPAASLNGQLILGDAATGRHSWTGTLVGLALFSRAVDANEASRHHVSWTTRNLSELTDDRSLAALYRFDERRGHIARDHSKSGHHLTIPANYVLLRKTMLAFPGIEFPIRQSMLGDVALNIFGFVPLGFLVFYNRQFTASNRLRAIAFATTMGFLLSLVIEIGQAWLPTRHSTIADLVLNTAGALIGAIFAARSSLFLKPHSARRLLDDSQIARWDRVGE